MADKWDEFFNSPTTPSQQFDQAFKQIGQYTTGLSSEYNGISAPPVKAAAGQPGGFGGFLQKIINVGQQTGGMAKQLGGAALGFIGHSAQDIYKSTTGTLETVGRLPVEIIRSNIDSYRVDELNIKRRQLSREYGAGKLSKRDYKDRLAELNKESEDINKSVQTTLDWTNKKTVAERNREIADTAVNILSFGSLSLAELGGKQALQAGSREALDALMTQSATKLESVMLKNPAMRSLVTRNLEAMAEREAKTVAGQSAWQFVQMNGKKLATDLLIKRPVFYQSNIGQAESLYKNILEGDYKGALTDVAWLGSQAINGGPLGAAKNLAGYTKSAVAKFAKGKGSVLDELSKHIGSKDWKQFADYVASNPEAKKAAQVLQDSNLFVTKGNVKRAVDNILLSYSHLDPATLTPEMIIKDITKHRDAYELLENAKKSGILDNLGDAKDRLAVVKWDAFTRTSLADKVRRTSPVGEINKEAITKLIHEMGDKLGFTNNFSLSSQLEVIVARSKTANEAADAIQAIDAAVGTGKYLPKPLQKQLAKLGYVLAEPAGGVQNKFIETENLSKLISSAIKGGDVIEKPNPALKKFSPKLIKEAEQFNTVDDFIASKTIYRGQPKEFTDLQKVENSDAIGNILTGRGVFTTSSKEMASTYGDNIFQLKKPSKGKVLNLADATDADLDKLGITSKSTRKLYRELINEGPDTGYYGKVYEIDGENWRVANIVTDSRTKETQYKLANLSYGGGQKYINKAEFEAKYPPKTTYTSLKDAEDILFEQIAEKQLPEDITWNQVKMGGADALSDNLYIDEIRDKVVKYLKEKGYDWVQHQGGIRAGAGEKLHDVYIALDNKALKPVDEKKLRKVYEAAKNPTIKEVTGDIFDPSAAPAPVISHIAGFLERFGISPEDSNGLASKKLGSSLTTHLNGTVAGKTLKLDVDGQKAIGGDVILYKLQDFIEKKPGIHGLRKISAGQSSLVDVRQMTINEIRQALASTVDGKLKLLDEKSAVDVRKALIKAYTDLPLEARGLADKLVDKTYQLNPMHKYYSRIQSALRYTYNPFFRATELVETKSLTHLQSGTFMWLKPREFAGTRKEWLNEGVKILEDVGIFKGQLPGEAAGDVTFGRITANLTNGQKKDLAGYAYTIAKSQGKELRQLANDNPEILDDALRAIVQYPNKGVLASPLARTMNLAFFPMRYNLKVTMLAAQVLEKQPANIQKAVLQSMFTMKDWLKSDEGIAWQSKNADAIALFKWITPVNSIEGALKIMTGSIDSISDMGQLGGLPFGIISQMLDSQGIINLNTPYVDPKTGSIFPKNIPKSLQARAAIAATDLLNSTFTYPGRTLGLPGKNQMVKDMVKNFIDTNGNDFESQIQTDRLTPLQEKWIEVLKDGGNNQDLIDELYQSPANGQFNGYTLPPLDLPFNPTYDASSKYKAPKAPKTLTKGKKQKVLAPTVKQPL